MAEPVNSVEAICFISVHKKAIKEGSNSDMWSTFKARLPEEQHHNMAVVHK